MTADSPALRALVIYGVCLPLALLVGYMLALPLDYSTIAFLGILLALLGSPLLLKWHYAFLVTAIHASAMAFFIPGRPDFWMVFVVLSLSVSVLQLTLSRRNRFLHAPTVGRPLLFLLAVVLVTMKLTGGMGFNVFGGTQVGGRRYFDVLGAILAYFALTTRRIPLHKAGLYCGLFFLSGVTLAVSSLIHFVSPSLYFIFWLFPPDSNPGEAAVTGSGDLVRLGGLAFGCVTVISFLLSRYGLKGIVAPGKIWRLLALVACCILSLFGGFRSILITIIFLLLFQGFLEGAFKSRWMPVVALSGILLIALGLPFVSKLPMTFQRALSVLPVNVSQEARQEAQVSSEWRIKMWQEVLPQVPQYLLLGRGYSIKAEDLTEVNASSQFSNITGAILAGDYHNGPLSVVMPLGIWGVLGFLWLIWAGYRLLYFNFRYGDPALKAPNTFLLAAFIAQSLLFFLVFGSLYSDLIRFTSLLGFSVALNGGMCRPAPAPARQPVNIKFRMPLRPGPALSRPGSAALPSSPRTAR